MVVYSKILTSYRVLPFQKERPFSVQSFLSHAATEESQRVNDSGVLLTHSGILIFFSFSFLLAQKRNKKVSRFLSGPGVLRSSLVQSGEGLLFLDTVTGHAHYNNGFEC